MDLPASQLFVLVVDICKCRVTNRNPNPDRIGYGPNKPSTMNL